MDYVRTGNRIAPDFQAVVQVGEAVRLSEYFSGKRWSISTPEHSTPGCTSGLRLSRRAIAPTYALLASPSLASSKDSVALHIKFAQKHSLPFLLLSDPDRQAIEAYDVWKEKSLMERSALALCGLRI